MDLVNALWPPTWKCLLGTAVAELITEVAVWKVAKKNSANSKGVEWESLLILSAHKQGQESISYNQFQLGRLAVMLE